MLLLVRINSLTAMGLKLTNNVPWPIDLGASLDTEKCVAVLIWEVSKQVKNLQSNMVVEIVGVDVDITVSYPYFGGNRFWFSCPICKRRCGVIYVHPFGPVGCRLCLNLTYPQQRYKGMIEESIQNRTAVD